MSLGKGKGGGGEENKDKQRKPTLFGGEISAELFFYWLNALSVRKAVNPDHLPGQELLGEERVWKYDLPTFCWVFVCLFSPLF